MLLAQNVAEWLTSFWFLALGSLFGVLLVAVLVVLIYAGSFAGLSKVSDSRQGFLFGGAIFSLLFFGCGTGIWYFSNQLNYANAEINRDQIIQNLFITLVLGIPTCVALGYGLLGAMSTKSRAQLGEWLTEGVGFWLLSITGGLGFLGLIGIGCQYLPSMRFGPLPNEVAESVSRWYSTGTRPPILHEIKDHSGDETQQIPVHFRSAELVHFKIETKSRIYLSVNPIDDEHGSESVIEIEPTKPGEPRQLSVGTGNQKEVVDVFHIKNVGGSPTTLKLQVITKPEIAEVELIYYSAFTVLGIFLFYLCQCSLMPKESAIAWATFKTETGQPLFAILLGCGIVFLLLAIYIPYNTFGEDIKMYATTGLPVILLMSVFFAIWAASKSVAEEIEGRTALTVLAKPIGRRQFVVGKVLGIAWAVGMLYLLLGLWFMFLNSYKPVYDGVEGSLGRITWQQCYISMVRLVPALVLHYMETLVFIFLAAMISTRMAIRSNLMICMSIYVLGHITPLLLQTKRKLRRCGGCWSDYLDGDPCVVSL